MQSGTSQQTLKKVVTDRKSFNSKHCTVCTVSWKTTSITINYHIICIESLKYYRNLGVTIAYDDYLDLSLISWTKFPLIMESPFRINR